MKVHAPLSVQVYQQPDKKWVLCTDYEVPLPYRELSHVGEYLVRVIFDHDWRDAPDSYSVEICDEGESLTWYDSFESYIKTANHYVVPLALEEVAQALGADQTAYHLGEFKIPSEELVEDAIYEDHATRSAHPGMPKFCAMPELIEAVVKRWEALNLIALFSVS
jgi:hypothetical protein